MIYSMTVTPEAEEDLLQAFLWYEDQRKGLGHHFMLQVAAGMDLVKRNPDIHPEEYKGTRKHLIRRFPYKIIYVIEPERITIIAVLHSKRNPALIRERLA